MKPITPLVGFNISPPNCCICGSRDARRTRVGTFYCVTHSAEAKAYVDSVRDVSAEELHARVMDAATWLRP